MIKTLFVCHEGQRTGAPLLLLWLIRWLKSHTSIQPVVALMRDGPLKAEFSALCPTYTFERPGLERWHRRLRRKLLTGPPLDPDGWLAALVAREQPDCLYLNTLVLGGMLGSLPLDPQRIRVISHVHEMEIGLQLSSNRADVERQLAASEVVIACAGGVRDNLINNYHLAPERCTLITEYIPYNEPQQLLELRCNDDPSQAVIATLRQHRAAGEFLFGMAGSAIDRKGFDLFPLLLRACERQFGSVPFRGVWVGCSPGSLPHAKAERDLNLLGLAHRALLLPGVSCGAAALRELDVLALLSREDPYPVVALESGAMGIPTVCFRHSGGIAELAEAGCGLAVDYLDLDAFAKALYLLQQDKSERQRLGEAFRKRVFAANTVATQAPRIAALIEGR
jgi:glycosyltransferase involved in cell wall biosynthesis